MGTGNRISERTLCEASGIQVEVIVESGPGRVRKLRATLARVALVEGRLYIYVSSDKIYSDLSGTGNFIEDPNCLPQREISLIEPEEIEENGRHAVCSGRTKVVFQK